MGNQRHRKGKSLENISRLGERLRSTPDNLRLRLAFALFCAKRSHWDKSSGGVASERLSSSKDPRILIALARTLFLLSHRRRLLLFPERTAILHQAKDAIEMAIAVSDTPCALRLHSKILAELRFTNEAVESLKKSCLKAPLRCRPAAELGAVLMDLGRTSEAKDAFRKAVKIDRLDGATQFRLAQLRGHEDPENEIRFIEEEIERVERPVAGRLGLHLAYYLRKQKLSTKHLATTLPGMR